MMSTLTIVIEAILLATTGVSLKALPRDTRWLSYAVLVLAVAVALNAIFGAAETASKGTQWLIENTATLRSALLSSIRPDAPKNSGTDASDYIDQIQMRIVYGATDATLKPNNLASMIDEYSRTLDSRPDDASTLFKRGAVYYFSKQYDLARKDFDRGIGLSPNDALAYSSARMIVRTRWVTVGSAASGEPWRRSRS